MNWTASLRSSRRLRELVWVLLAALGVFLPAMAYRARQEETALAAEFPAYAEYRRRTGMFFPKLSHLSNPK